MPLGLGTRIRWRGDRCVRRQRPECSSMPSRPATRAQRYFPSSEHARRAHRRDPDRVIQRHHRLGTAGLFSAADEMFNRGLLESLLVTMPQTIATAIGWQKANVKAPENAELSTASPVIKSETSPGSRALSRRAAGLTDESTESPRTPPRGEFDQNRHTTGRTSTRGRTRSILPARSNRSERRRIRFGENPPAPTPVRPVPYPDSSRHTGTAAAGRNTDADHRWRKSPNGRPKRTSRLQRHVATTKKPRLPHGATTHSNDSKTTPITPAWILA